MKQHFNEKYSAEYNNKVLQLLSDGLPQKQIAGELKVPERNIAYILAKLRVQYNCPNNECLVKKAVQDRIIS